MKRNVFSDIDSEKYAERLTAHADFSEEEMNRAFEKSCQKAERMNSGESTEKDSAFELIELKSARTRFMPIRAAACIVAVVIGASVFGIIRTVDPPAAEGESEASISHSTEDHTQIETSFEAEKKQEGNESNYTTETAEENGTSSAAQKPKASAVSSAIESPRSAVSSAVESPRSAVSSAVEIPRSAVSSAVESSHSDEIYDGAETESSEVDDVCGTGEVTEPIQTEPDYWELNFDYTAGATSENVLKITPDLTYGQVITLLGAPDTCGTLKGYAQYLIDGERLLMLFYESESDPIGISGKLLLKDAPLISDMFCDEKEFKFECYVVKVTVKGDEDTPYLMRVTCPQKMGIHCADVRFNVELSDYLRSADVREGDRLMISCDDTILETYPCQLYAHEVEKIELREPRYVVGEEE